MSEPLGAANRVTAASVDSALPPRFAPLALWASQLEFSDLPDEAVDLVKKSIRDAIGCALFGSTLPWAQAIAHALDGQSGNGDGGSTIWGIGKRVDTIAAAVANGTAIQSYELDDSHVEASLHGSSAMLPATMGLAELRGGVSGQELITALAAGWESGLRLNRCVGTLLQLGWHPPTIMGTIAAATASGRLLRLDPAQMLQCLSLAILQASGITAVQYGGMAKRLYAGRAAEIGVQSALYAERGFTAPVNSLEHPVGGFLHTFGPGRTYNYDALSSGLGEQFAASRISFKLYPSCGAMHPALDMLIDLTAENDVRANEIEHIDLFMAEYSVKHVGYRYEPGNTTTAQFSAQYAFAVFLLEGDVFIDQFRDDLLADPRVLELVDRIIIRHDPSLEGPDLGSRRAARVDIHLADGRVLSRHGQTAKGHPGRPATEEELRSKFDKLAGTVLTTEDVSAISDATSSLDAIADTTTLVRLISIPTS